MAPYGEKRRKVHVTPFSTMSYDFFFIFFMILYFKPHSHPYNLQNIIVNTDIFTKRVATSPPPTPPPPPPHSLLISPSSMNLKRMICMCLFGIQLSRLTN